MVEGGMKCVKYLIFIFNFIFWLSGLGIIIVGALVQTKYTKYFTYLGSGFTSVPIFLIVVGCIVAIIGFFGCCGAIKENYCMIITFAVLLGTIFIFEIAAGIAAFVLKKEVESTVKQQLKTHIDKYNESDQDDPFTKAVNYLQIDFDCCGITNSSQWDNFTSTHNGSYPPSCCKDPKGTPGLCDGPPDREEFRKNSCWGKFYDFIMKNLEVIIGVGIGIAFIQVFGIVLACCLGRAVRKEYEVV